MCTIHTRRQAPSMASDPIAALEYETMVFGRHLSLLPRRPRRRGGVLDHSAYVLLALLCCRGPMSIRQLSEITGLEASTLNRQSAALRRDGHAERTADPGGAPAKKFRLTDAGRQSFRQALRVSPRLRDSLGADWP